MSGFFTDSVASMLFFVSLARTPSFPFMGFPHDYFYALYRCAVAYGLFLNLFTYTAPPLSQ